MIASKKGEDAAWIYIHGASNRGQCIVLQRLTGPLRMEISPVRRRFEPNVISCYSD